jgi:two-component system, sensor histidine kinase YesM
MFIQKAYYRILHMKISMKLTLSYLAAATICMLILSMFFYVNTKNYIEKQTTGLLTQTLRQAKDNIDYKVELYNKLADSIYLNTNFQDVLFDDYPHQADKPELQSKILAYIRPYKGSYQDLQNIKLITTNPTIPQYGNEIISESTQRVNSWYRMVLDQNNKVIWANGNDYEMPDMIILGRKLNHLLYDSFLGILRIELSKENFFGALSKVGESGNGWFDVIDSSNDYIYTGMLTDNSRLKAEVYNEHKKLLSDNPGKAVVINADNRKFITMQDEIQFTNWKILYTLPYAGYADAVKRLKYAVTGFLLLSALIFIAISWFLASKFTKRIRELSQSMEKIQTGQFDVFINYTANDEIGFLINGFNIMARKLKELIEEVYIIKIKKKESELSALQAQINPHFLYNTLASISMLGMRIGGEDITKMSNSLAKFYKKSLSKGKNIILIKDEIEQVHAYMDIQNIRFKGKINVVFEIDDSILEARSLKLMLQPFVENAIAHGMYKEKKTLNIRIVVCKDGENILWEVIDDGIGISKVRLKSILNSEENAESGYGIVNVDQRIKLFFGDNYGVSIYSRVGIGTAVRIVTPYMTASL